MQSIQQASLVFLMKEDEVLLAQKKRGYAKGKWLGVGGKLEPFENILNCAVRECQEEISVTPTNLEHIATLDFIFPTKPTWSQQVFAYATQTWNGEPKESEEMAPQWFKHEDLPYDNMWSDAIHWMPNILMGEKLYAEFYFDNNLQVSQNNVIIGSPNANTTSNPQKEGGQNG